MNVSRTILNYGETNPAFKERIYVVVAKTVQSPLVLQSLPSGNRWALRATSETKTIIQPPGRIAAQVAHVVTVARLDRHVRDRFGDCPVTTIIFSVPDSFQLAFFLDLFQEKGVSRFQFNDTNDEYGFEPVTTAICTAPVLPQAVEGITDYLPLWDGQP